MSVSLRLIQHLARRRARKLGPDGLAKQLDIEGTFRPQIAAKFAERYRSPRSRRAAHEGVMLGFMDHDGIDLDDPETWED